MLTYVLLANLAFFRGKSIKILKHLETTLDSFLDGRVKAFQSKSGFRAGIDSVLLASSVNQNSAKILELGAGNGVTTCCALADLENATACLAEIDEDAILLCKKNIEQNQYVTRVRILQLDITAKGEIRQNTGLLSDHYTSIIANPPFFAKETGNQSPDNSRGIARHMAQDDLDKWVKTAATSAAPKAEIIFIFTMTALPDLLESFGKRFGNINVLPIVSRQGEPANRVLIRGIKGSRAPFKMLSPLVLHNTDGQEYTPIAEAIFRGKSRLHW